VSNVEGEEPIENVARSVEALTGTPLAWVDTVLGAVPTVLPMPPALSSPRTGDLATKNSANIGNAIIVFAKGCVTAGDGGGGLFYWDNSSATGDDGGTIIVPSAGSVASMVSRETSFYPQTFSFRTRRSNSLRRAARTPLPSSARSLAQAESAISALCA
jgi:hypothetical protein